MSMQLEPAALYDDGTPGDYEDNPFVNDRCLSNADAIVTAGPPPTEGIFFKLEPGSLAYECPSVMGIVYALHMN